MVRAEFKEIAAYIRGAYRSEVIPDQTTFEVWYSLLYDLDYNIAKAAVQTYCATEHFPPTPADIRNKAKLFIPKEKTLSEGEAWELVRKAIGKSSYYAQEEFDKLPKECQRAIGGPDVMRDAALNGADALPVVQSNFIKAYRIQLSSSEEMKALPENLRTLIESTGQLMLGDNE